MLTIAGGKPVCAIEEYEPLAPTMPLISPGWPPVAHYGGCDNSQAVLHQHTHGDCGHLHPDGTDEHLVIIGPEERFW